MSRAGRKKVEKIPGHPLGDVFRGEMATLLETATLTSAGVRFKFAGTPEIR